MKELLKIKGVLIGSAVVLVVLMVLVIVIVVLARKKKIETVPLPSETDWGRALTESESATIKRIADGLYNDMKGLNVFKRNYDIYVEYNNANDKIFVGVANYFAQTYGNGESLAQWMKDEAYSWTSYQTDGLADAIIARLAQHGIN
ncbi:MAG: hypothetical protein J6R26_06365 [Paludibacteraceae bacterium]|nr:hypothetical protein [Paludibacteraceae bacterium]